jgi:hypothetical protein
MSTVFDLFQLSRGKPINKVSDQTRIMRLKLCNACPKLLRVTGNCKECGCFVTEKTKYAAESCPLKKW